MVYNEYVECSSVYTLEFFFSLIFLPLFILGAIMCGSFFLYQKVTSRIILALSKYVFPVEGILSRLTLDSLSPHSLDSDC